MHDMQISRLQQGLHREPIPLWVGTLLTDHDALKVRGVCPVISGCHEQRSGHFGGPCRAVAVANRPEIGGDAVDTRVVGDCERGTRRVIDARV
jgi:hypothetical protein